MITKAFAVYDSKALTFSVPFFMPTVGAAVRLFADGANDPQTQLCKHPGDFVLYQVGEFDDQTGKFVSLEVHQHLGMAKDFKVERQGAIDLGEVISAKIKADNGVVA